MKTSTRPFIGRHYELNCLHEAFSQPRGSLIVLYGRRRVGKTRLIEEFCRKKQFLRFEGLEKGSLNDQLAHFMGQFAGQTKNPLLAKVVCSSWQEAFEHLTHFLSTTKNKYIVVFDEFPWMIDKDEKNIAMFKYYWDNHWSRLNVTLLLCGSINTFMVKNVVFSSALYGRIHREIHLEPLSPQEVYDYFGGKRSHREILDLYMVFGGIPKYLEEINPAESVIQNINRLCFLKDAFFVREFQRLFQDEFQKSNVYADIVAILAKYPHLNYAEIMKFLKVKVGGGYGDYLKNLSLAGFVEAYSPLHKNKTQLIRYRLQDEYLLFYLNLIKPHLQLIEENKGEKIFLNILGKPRWSSWAGLAFERFCLKQSRRIQEILRIDQLVKNFGSCFNRKTTAKNGFQIDLMFIRHDQVITLCEIKYQTKPIGTEIIPILEQKTKLIKFNKRQVVEWILITVSPPSEALSETHYFNRILTLEDLF